MDKPIIKSAYFKRALLFLCGSGKCDAIAFVCTSKNLTFYPMYIENNADEFTACFDLASGLGGKPLPTAAWALRFDGNTELQFDGERDFSDNGGIYTVALICDELGVNLFSKCSPTHVGIKLKIADIALNTVFRISQIAAKTGAQKGCRVLFTSMSRASLSGNEKYVYDEIMRRDELKKSLIYSLRFRIRAESVFILKQHGRSEKATSSYSMITTHWFTDLITAMMLRSHSCGTPAVLSRHSDTAVLVKRVRRASTVTVIAVILTHLSAATGYVNITPKHSEYL